MASLVARARRNHDVRERLRLALGAISKRLDIPVPSPARRARDAELQPILELERFADFAEAVETRLAELATDDEAPGGYGSWTVAMLREEIATRGLEAPSRANKAELVALLEADDAADDEELEPEEDEEPDSEEDEGA